MKAIDGIIDKYLEFVNETSHDVDGYDYGLPYGYKEAMELLHNKLKDIIVLLLNKQREMIVEELPTHLIGTNDFRSYARLSMAVLNTKLEDK